MSKQRIDYLDYAKGICIILMVACHAFASAGKYGHQIEAMALSRSIIYQFHMPAFFILSGMFFKNEYTENLLLCVKDKLKHLWKPFVYSNMLFLLLHNILCRFGIYDSEMYRIGGVRGHLKNALLITAFGYREQLTGPTWFLAALFWANIAFSIIVFLTRRIQNNRVKYICIVIYVLILYAIGYTYREIGFASFMKGMVGTHFVMLGWLVKQYRSHLKLNLPTAIIAIAVLLVSAIINPETDMSRSAYENPVFYTLGGVAGTILILFIGCFIYEHFKSKGLRLGLQVVGKGTLYILILHFTAFKVVTWIIGLLNIFDDVDLSQYPTANYYGRGTLSICVFFIYIIIGIVLPLLIKYMRNHLKH